MEYRVLGKNLIVSPIGLGCMGFTHAYGPAMEDKPAIENIRKAYELGYTFFDTAECYVGQRENGSIAYNEEIVGEALKPYRNQVKIATKYGVEISKSGKLLVDSSPETIKKAVEGSLRRLQTDYIDLYYQHRIDPNVEPEVVAEVMGELIKEGKILNWGISEVNKDYLIKANKITPVAAIQNRLSMMARWNEELFSTLEELGVGFVAFSPLANGFLTDAFKQGETFAEGDYRNFMPQYKDESFEKNRDLLSLIRNMAKDYNASPAQLSLAWLLAKRSYIVPIPGSRKIERIKSNLEASNIYISSSDMAQLDKALDQIEMSEVFGGSSVNKKEN